MAVIKKHPNFLKKTFGSEEYLRLKERKFKSESVVADFYAKKAFVRAVGMVPLEKSEEKTTL